MGDRTERDQQHDIIMQSLEQMRSQLLNDIQSLDMGLNDTKEKFNENLIEFGGIKDDMLGL
jgi:hypothetical protein